MNKTTIEKSLGNALNSAPTISFAELAAMPYIKMSEHDYITAQVEKKSSAHLRQSALAAACCLLVIVSMSGWYLQNRITSSTITLDVNPSIQIITNHKDKVLSVKALNEDAEVIVGDNDYKDAKLEETVIILLNSLVDQKYLDQEKNTILISVMSKNVKKANAIMTEVDTTIRENLIAQNITPTIMSQIIAKETDRNYLARKYHISEGKMNLIQSMITLNNKLSLDMLANMSIEQLLKLAEENSMDLSGYLSIDDDGVTPSKENAEDLQEDDSSLEDNEEQGEDNEEQGEDNEEQGEDNEEQGEDNEEQGEDNKEQGEDNEEQGEDNEEQGEDNEEQGEDNEEDSADNQEDQDANRNDDSDSQEKDEENSDEVKNNNEDNDRSDQNNIESNEDEESGTGEGDEEDNEDSIQDQGSEQVDGGTFTSETRDEDNDIITDASEKSDISENENEED